jgi:hypothetical protein
MGKSPFRSVTLGCFVGGPSPFEKNLTLGCIATGESDDLTPGVPLYPTEQNRSLNDLTLDGLRPSQSLTPEEANVLLSTTNGRNIECAKWLCKKQKGGKVHFYCFIHNSK